MLGGKGLYMAGLGFSTAWFALPVLPVAGRRRSSCERGTWPDVQENLSRDSCLR